MQSETSVYESKTIVFEADALRLVELKAGRKYEEGEVLEVNSTTGQAEELADATKAKFILTVEADATSAPVSVNVLAAGKVDINQCKFNSSLVKKDVVEALHDHGIYAQ